MCSCVCVCVSTRQLHVAACAIHKNTSHKLHEFMRSNPCIFFWYTHARDLRYLKAYERETNKQTNEWIRKYCYHWLWLHLTKLNLYTCHLDTTKIKKSTKSKIPSNLTSKHSLYLQIILKNCYDARIFHSNQIALHESTACWKSYCCCC